MVQMGKHDSLEGLPNLPYFSSAKGMHDSDSAPFEAVYHQENALIYIRSAWISCLRGTVFLRKVLFLKRRLSDKNSG